MKAPLPEETSWNALGENTYDRKAYEQICAEFGVDPNTDWRRKNLPNYGLGNVYTNGHIIGDGWYYPNHVFGWRGQIGGDGTNITHDLKAPSGWLKESFTEATASGVLHADYIAQDETPAWTTFILDKSEGFTQAGVVRLDDSIQMYVWLILGTQGSMRADIVDGSRAFPVQSEFVRSLLTTIKSPVNPPDALKRYQDVLTYARSKVDYVYGYGLTMGPSDMRLRVGTIVGYNNFNYYGNSGYECRYQPAC
jgi:hypothetical protein